MEVILTEEAEKSLRSFIYEVAVEEFSRAKTDLGIGRPLNQKEIAEYLDVSTTTVRQWEKEGLPFGSLGSQTKFYDREACKNWVLNQHR